MKFKELEPMRGIVRQRGWAMRTSTSAGYFESAAIPLLTGRALAPSDRQDGLPVVVVNRELARRYFGSAAAALGKRVMRSLLYGIGPVDLPARGVARTSDAESHATSCRNI